MQGHARVEPFAAFTNMHRNLTYGDSAKNSYLFNGRIGLGIERDRSFTSMPLQEVMDTIHRGGHI